ncbi:hypothetical protein JJV70_09205 [Streptomyces sp. JJ66]|nr:hypothetical protein [Streptomyces sp. JJ66]
MARAFVACICALLSLLLPAHGRHRRSEGNPPTPVRAPHAEPTPAPVAPGLPVQPRHVEEPPRGSVPHSVAFSSAAADDEVRVDEGDPVRWYVVLAQSAAWLEQVKAERRLQRQRRVTLLLALDGIDTGPDVIHGVRVPMAS